MTAQQLPLDRAPETSAKSSTFFPRRWRKALIASVLGFAIVFVPLALWLYDDQVKQRAIRELPDAERKALYERTLSTLETTCAARGADGLASFCRDQAQLIVRFPECDQRCTAVAERWQAPTR